MPEQEFSLVIFKPDAIRLNKVADIVRIIQLLNLDLMEERKVKIDMELYQKWRNRGVYDNFYWEDAYFMASTPVIIQLWCGGDALQKLACLKKEIRRSLTPPDASPHENLIHAPDNLAEFKKETSLFLGWAE